MRAATHAQRVLSTLNQQRAAGSFCDTLLKVSDGAIYAAHRGVLACFSRAFQGADMSAAKELSLQECCGEGLEVLLDFVYTGQLKLDPGVLDKVQSAADSLCVPEALALCQRFRDTPADAPLKRGRGRPRKTETDVFLEDKTATSAKEECGSDALAGSVNALATTRSGRVVKGPRRLMADEDDGAPPTFCHDIAEQTTGESQASEQPSDTNDTDAGEDFDTTVPDSDEEYVPVHQSGPGETASLAASQPETNGDDGEAAEDESSNSVQCPVCRKVFKSKYYLKVHNRRHTGEKPFGCQKCGKRYFRKENLMIHEVRHCTTPQTYTCPTCSSTFPGKEELRAHVVSHTGHTPYKCSTCAEHFMYKKNLTAHMMKVHGHPKPHACPQCPKTFLTRSELRVHDASKHRGEKPFVCEECGHRASSRNGLQMHIKAIHRNERPFVCSVCNHAFSQKNNLNMHLRVHSGERPYQCHLCGKTFRTQASLDKHHRTHTGERPFPCDACERRFSEKGALLRHKASKHEEGRPHCCHICSKTFKAKEQLSVHLRRHKGMRKFECGDCGYKFTRQAHLRRHHQIHKRTENYNPRQRKLRNVVVEDDDDDDDAGGDGDFHATEAAETPAVVMETSAPLPTTSAAPGLDLDCVVSVVIE
ncbi:telomere zinc finger-associated protein [Nerophis lumbriciformis]|uniref:telomere zinc finger-associated protein n=1 Tax=Nerophis lumbriciformis TaxID=546530 RepID=UPI002ADF692A|nr:telomere zinc finger-associated protein-like [Nerophis lumbriciformis]XP_061781093.1 telomere zinc finger-associated protein-like [Nerophis lumbriciformis]XP_061781102.1 telomere zinc finger-associated protein-like [Nerophis lumbriciformis]